MNTRIIYVFIAGLGGCAAPSKMIYIKSDGTQAIPQQIALDTTICDGESAKANLSAGTNYYGGILTHAVEEGRRNQVAGKVHEGCMASKGYIFVPEDQAMHISAMAAETNQTLHKKQK